MADSPADSPTPGGLRCPECGFGNAPNSLYCQDCGAKLPVAPPSYLSAAPEAAPAADLSGASAPKAPKAYGKKPRILSARRTGASAGSLVGVTIRTVLYAAFIAGVIQLFRAPRDFPAPVTALDAKVIEQVRARFTDSTHRGIPITAPWDRTNAYLAGVLVPAEAGTTSSFTRAVVGYHPDGFALTVEKLVAGHIPVYTTMAYSVVSRGNGLSLVPAGGAIGRIPVPGWAAPVLPLIGGNLAPALQFELDLLGSARNVTFAPAAARIEFAPAHP